MNEKQYNRNMKVAVFGCTGYAGQVLLRLLMDHPSVEKIWAVSSSSKSLPIAESDGGLGPDIHGKLAQGRFYSSYQEALQAKPDAIFLALPHGSSAQIAENFLDYSAVFDLSADLRLKNEQIHKAYYGSEAPLKNMRSQAVYGLPEHYRIPLQTANLTAMPGCYPTSILLPLLPLAKVNLLHEKSHIIINSLSGISGAGRSSKTNFLYTECSENSAAYCPGQTHRHYPEIIQELSHAHCRSQVLFTPHLIPIRRGLLSTINLITDQSAIETALGKVSKQTEGSKIETIHQAIGRILESAYSQEKFIQLTGCRIPSTANVLHSNRCDIGWTTTETLQGQTAVTLFSVIDNLMKGAAGQAVQAFNIRFAFPENAGLPLCSQI